MLIIFRGWGGLVTPLLGVLALLLAVPVGQSLHGSPNSTPAQDDGFAIMLMGGVLSAVIWQFGRWLNDGSKDRDVIDKKTGQEITLRRRHTFFLVPVEYWSVIYAVLFGLFGYGVMTGK